MCYPVECPSCHKTTWAGCGEHVADVKSSVPPAQWGTCDAKEPAHHEAGAETGCRAALFGRRQRVQEHRQERPMIGRPPAPERHAVP